MKDLRLLLCWLCLQAAGCSWFSPELAVRLLLPEPPGHWLEAFPDLHYELVTPGADGAPQCIPWPPDRELSIPKEPNWPVLAVPLVQDGQVRLPPAGAVWPLDLASGGQELALSWEGGPLAETLLALRRERVDVSALNTGRLALEMHDRFGGDPWRLDLVYLAESLASGQFQVTDIRALACRDVLLPVPAGRWFLESPFRLPQLAAEGEELLLLQLPFGEHRLFRSDGLAGYALFVGERDVLLFTVSGHQSGNEVLGENDEDQ